MLLDIVTYPDPRLKAQCAPVEDITDEIRQLAADMTETMYAAPGVGLAAPQIGKDIRLFIVDCTPWAEEDASCIDYKGAFINAEIYEMSP